MFTNVTRYRITISKELLMPILLLFQVKRNTLFVKVINCNMLSLMNSHIKNKNFLVFSVLIDIACRHNLTKTLVDYYITYEYNQFCNLEINGAHPTNL